MSGEKTPKNLGADGMDLSDDECNVKETPVEVVLKQSSASKQQKASLMNNLFTWSGSEKYLRVKDFRMACNISAEQQYYYCIKDS